MPGWAPPRYYTLAMSTALIWQIISTGSADTSALGEILGANLTGGEVLALRSDLGGGKTTLTQGLARGLKSQDTVSSPTFTLNKIYKGRDGLEIHHYDFYRLDEPGIMRDELAESLNDPKVITVIEWGDIVEEVLPGNVISVELKPTANDPDERQITISYPENKSNLIHAVETAWKEVRP